MSRNRTGAVIDGTRYSNEEMAAVLEQVDREFCRAAGTSDSHGIRVGTLWEIARALRSGTALRAAVASEWEGRSGK